MTKKLAARYRWEEDDSCTFFTPEGREVVQSPEAAETAGKSRADVLAAMFSISEGGRND